MIISLIAAIDKQGGLGKNNELLCYLPNDLKYFKKTTLNKPIIMVYNTFLSIGKALPNRRNIVLTSKKGLEVNNIEFVSTIENALSLCMDANEIMVIGGASIYKQFLSRAHKLYLTSIEHSFDADVFFPSMNAHEWQIISTNRQEIDDKNAYAHAFVVYEKLL